MSLDEMASKAFSVSSFTTVGHLLHINLRDNLLQHKYEIGKALLNKNPRALAVVNKVNSIDNTYRNFEIEILAKKDDCTMTDDELMICEVNENKCRFKLDFRKVYWNSRLCTEHDRIIGKLNKGIDIVFDLFAGVGPFSVPAAKSKCRVYSNDLNPDAIKWLEVNMKRNKIPDERYEILHKDAKDFILEDMRSILLEEYKNIQHDDLATKPKIHILMNLPALAPTFLQNFVGLFNQPDPNESNRELEELTQLYRHLGLEHIVYCYCFLKGAYENPKAQVREMIEENIGRELGDDQLLDIFRVRNVAPFKEMYRVDIKLDDRILFDIKSPISIMRTSNGSTPHSSKKVKISEKSLKRYRGDSTSQDSFDETCSKRSRVSEYCSLM